MTPTHRRLLLTCFFASVAATTLGVVFAPTLLAFHPLALVAASPLARHLVIAAADAGAVAFVAVVVCRRMWDSAIAFEVGRTYGEDGLSWFETRYPRPSRAVRRVERWFRRGGAVVVFCLPGFAVGFLAGTAGMRRALFVPVACAGHVTWAVGSYLAGDAISPWTDVVITFVRANVALLTLVSVLGCVAVVWLRSAGENRGEDRGEDRGENRGENRQTAEAD